MTIVSISEAARLTGKARTTIQRRLKSGDLSAVRQYDGSRGIDTAELIRVFGGLSDTDESRTDSQQSAAAGDTGGSSGRLSARIEIAQLQGRVAALEAENALLREQLTEAREDKRELFKLAAGREKLPAPGWWARLRGRE